MNIATNILSRLGLLGLAKGSTVAAQATVTTVDADHNALDVAIQGTPALPADAATATLQTAGNSSLSTLAGIVASGAAIVKPKAGLSYNSAALERSCVASASAASPAMARMWNAGASSRFLQGHNANSLPGNGAIPNDVQNAGATSPCFINYVAPSNAYSTGVVFACSTTAASLTITGANDALFSIVLFPSES